MRKILILLLIVVSFSANAQRKLFGLDLNATPALTKRVAIGEVGSLSENMTLQQLSDLLVINLDVYSKVEVDNLFTNYLSKTNLASYIPTLDYHPSTKKYVDESIDGVVNNSLEQGWTELTGNYRMQWMKFTSNTDSPQIVTFPYAFPTACVNIILGSNAETNTDIVKSNTSFTFDRDNAVDADRVIYVQAIGY